MKTFRNFLVANLCALVPLWVVAFGWMPDQVKVYMRGTAAESVSIVADGTVILGENYGTWTDGRIWRFYLRDGMEWKDLAFRLPGDSGATAVERVELQKWKLLSLGKAGAGLEKTESGTNEYRYSQPRFERMGFASWKMGMGLLGLECLLFVFSWFFARGHRGEHWRILLPSVLGISLALTLLMQVALPIQSYIANQSSFPFTLPALCGAVAVRFALLMAWNTLAIFLLARCFGRWVLAPLFAFTVCAYLESGILAEGQPSLNGDWTFFADRARARWDAAVWGGVFALVFAAHRWMKDWYGLAGLCAVVMLAASMLDIKHERKADTSNLIVNDFSSIETVIRSVTYSTNRNVMVFVIDSLEREQAHAIMEDPEAGPELREKFRGFTEYVDNVGTGNSSEYAVAAMFTGKYPENPAELPTYFVSVFGGESVLGDYLAEGANAYLATTALGYGYTNRKIRSENAPAHRGEGWALEEFSRFRWMPFAAKWKIARITELRVPHSDGVDRENIAYPVLGKGAVLNGCNLSFLFLHTHGVHFPVLWNRRGERLVAADDTHSGAVEAGIFVLGQLGKLFDTYRERGIYDNSLILVLADHGNHGHKADTPEGLPGTARPFLWVKEPWNRKEFAPSNLPTSHVKIADLLRAACRKELDGNEVGHLLTSERRLYREAFGLTRTDWWVENDGSITIESGELSTSSVGDLRPLKAGHAYSFDLTAAGASELADIELSGFYLKYWPRWFNDRPEVGIRFRPPAEQGTWRVKLAVLPWMWSPDETENNDRSACFRFFSKEQGVEARTPGEADLRGLVADKDGLISIAIERETGIRSICRLTRLIVEEEK
jgi:hypothetical protein